MKLKREGTPKQDINMKKLFRRNQIIITTLAIMIAAAGYLNYAGKRDLAASTGEDIYQAGTFDISEEDLLAENQKKGQEDTAMIEEAQPQAEGTKLQAEASQDGSFLAEADAGTDQAVIDSWDGGEEAGMVKQFQQKIMVQTLILFMKSCRNIRIPAFHLCRLK